jgi:hypothetical protein
MVIICLFIEMVVESSWLTKSTFYLIAHHAYCDRAK